MDLELHSLDFQFDVTAEDADNGSEVWSNDPGERNEGRYEWFDG